MKKRIYLILLICLTLPALPAMAEWQEIVISLGQNVWASSTFCETLRDKRVCYGQEFVFDGDPATCWVEAAAGDGVGERRVFRTTSSRFMGCPVYAWRSWRSTGAANITTPV